MAFENATTLDDDPNYYDRGPGPSHIALAITLGAILLVGLARVYRVLQKLDVLMTSIVRRVPEGMRAAQCGACFTTQHIGIHGRYFICFGCRSANRIPRDISRADYAQVLVTSTGPLRSYEFKKGGDNFWQEVGQEVLPGLPEGELDVKAENLHYRSSFCWACSKETCCRLEEFPNGVQVANLPPFAEPQGEANVSNSEETRSANCDAVSTQIVGPAIIGQQMDNIDEVISSTSYTGGMTQCVVCLDHIGCMVLLPCAHGSVCEECATRIAQNRASGGAHCPHCRASIEILVKLHQVCGDIARGVEVRIPIARG